MMRATHRLRSRRGRFGALIAALVLPAAVAPAAWAGTYTVQASGNALCGLAVFQANVPGFNHVCGSSGVGVTAPLGGAAVGDRGLWVVQSPNPALVITNADFLAPVATFTTSPGWGGGSYWAGGGSSWTSSVTTFSAPMDSSYVGIQLVCGDSKGCAPVPKGTFPPGVGLGGVSLTVNENTGPSLIAVGADNLFYQGGWVWNAADDPWPVELTGDDPSGICGFAAKVASPTKQTVLQGATPQGTTPSQFQQCANDWTWPGTVDTDQFVPTSGSLQLALSATDAANNTTSASTTIKVDNVAPTISLTPQNDVNPGGWAVNHAVTVTVAPTAGPSGIADVSCSDTVGASTSPLSLAADPGAGGDYQVTVDGNGAHHIACSVTNNAVNPQGQHNVGSATETVKIDEQAPSLQFEPANPANPDQVVVQTGDSESAVAGGGIAIAPAGGAEWQSLPTSLTSSGQLVATIPDAHLRGVYVIRATATSQVGNTGTASETVQLPLRVAARSLLSFNPIRGGVAARRVRERVRVGWHWKTIRRHGRRLRIRVGGHFRTVTVVRPLARCRSVRRGPGYNRPRREICHTPRIAALTHARVTFGGRRRVYGMLLSSAGVALAGQSVSVWTAPENGSDAFREVKTVRTGPDGQWSATLPAGPSRIVQARFGGSATVLPASGQGALRVPARIAVQVSPHQLSWSGWVTITGHLVGGYVPRDGVALRLLVRYPGSRRASPLLALRTDAHGRFRIRWTYNAGRGTLTIPFWVATDANESDYPYAAAASRHVPVTFSP
ncbi:hypothetical protein [Conexibacter sp. DBS9H8]|uniref:hypothetical protein n=1 Tax=Conexibacter sp. DBS9H8 TaxID=2937801 RepID=UPI002010372D|nr:hypothetical protein [Conexibacter sp. DBS9H8]